MSWNYVISSNATHMPTKRARSADVAVVLVLPVVVVVVLLLLGSFICRCRVIVVD